MNRVGEFGLNFQPAAFDGADQISPRRGVRIYGRTVEGTETRQTEERIKGMKSKEVRERLEQLSAEDVRLVAAQF
jgi:hypothetical protein